MCGRQLIIIFIVLLCIRSPTPELLSADMRQERERREWERNAYRETEDEGTKETEPTGPLHYQNVKHNGIHFYLLILLLFLFLQRSGLMALDIMHFLLKKRRDKVKLKH